MEEEKKRISDVWQFYTLPVMNAGRKFATCNVCFKEIKISGSSTSNLWHHRRKHEDKEGNTSVMFISYFFKI